ncbi:pyridoxamine 5'-phosphate oxidase family protein [Streptomyces sp. NPDC087437]|uniref:pyridoxamine 5'-phosphate oxidase family protein n=1 Tax=Streptomyces sp. NPDC087437 TaxID=3365789 RepID=UPI00380A7378
MNEDTAGRADRDLMRRIEVRLAQLGLTEEELAGQAGMSPRYFRHLIASGADFDPGGFLRVAAALGMTYQELLEGRCDAPAGQGGAAQHPVLMKLTTKECWERLGTHGIGRIALPAHPGPGVFPVNYIVDGMTVVYRTDPRGAAVAEPGGEVSFQVDHVDESRSVGWSVLLAGTAEHVTDPEAVQRLAEQSVSEPWAGGVRNLWIRVVPAEISGRRIHGL